MTSKKIITHLDDNRALRGFIDKVVINAGLGRASQLANFEEKILPQITRDIATITGQAPRVTRAKKSIAGFKIRTGQIIGVQVTLRRQKAVDFFKRFITIVLPRVRDFSGINPTAVDAGGVLNVGLKEHYVFSEINPEDSLFVFGLEVSVVPKQRDNASAREQYVLFGVPFKRTAPASGTPR